MNENTTKTIIYLLMVLGALLVMAGVGLALLTDIYLDNGVDGVWLIAGLIATGLFLLLPTKLLLTVQLMQKNDARRIHKQARLATRKPKVDASRTQHINQKENYHDQL